MLIPSILEGSGFCASPTRCAVRTPSVRSAPLQRFELRSSSPLALLEEVMDPRGGSETEPWAVGGQSSPGPGLSLTLRSGTFMGGCSGKEVAIVCARGSAVQQPTLTGCQRVPAPSSLCSGPMGLTGQL